MQDYRVTTNHVRKTAADRYEEMLDPIEIKRPIVVVPGILGSDLWSLTPTGGQGSQLWPPYTAEGGMLELANISKLDFAVQKVALAGAIFHAVYGELLAALRQMGYEDDPPPQRPKTLWLFPFDWTRSCDDSGKDLASLIKGTILPSKTPAWVDVDIVNHSIGGMVTRAARELHQAAIATSAYIDPQHGGSMKAYFALNSTTVPLFDRTVDRVFSGIFGSTNALAKMRRQASRWRSIYDVLPDGTQRLTPPRTLAAPDMQEELQRAAAFRRRLAAMPQERHIVFYCQSKRTRMPFIRHLFRKIFAGLPLTQSDRPIAAIAAKRHTERITSASYVGQSSEMFITTISGRHIWAPSMRIVHVALREFLVSS
jgi:hypothetical protein